MYFHANQSRYIKNDRYLITQGGAVYFDTEEIEDEIYLNMIKDKYINLNIHDSYFSKH